jgi:hypothetical protein
MKRRLSQAKTAKWYAEFPADVWSIITQHIPLGSYEMPNFSLLLRLHSANRMLSTIVLEVVLRYLYEFSLERNKRKEKINCLAMNGYAGFATYLEDFIYDASPRVDLERYINFCLFDTTYQTIPHISNLLSLLNFIYLESHARNPHYDENRKMWVYQRESPVVIADTLYRSIGNMMYFRPEIKKAVTLQRMSEVGVNSNLRNEDWKVRVRECLKNKGFGQEEVQAAFNEIYSTTHTGKRLAMIFDLIESDEEKKELEKRTIQTKAGCSKDMLEDVIVTIDGKRHHLYSDAIKEFRDRCFICKKPTVQNATYVFLLHTFHARNWKEITESDRFRVPPKKKLLLTSSHLLSKKAYDMYLLKEEKTPPICIDITNEEPQ